MPNRTGGNSPGTPQLAATASASSPVLNQLCVGRSKLAAQLGKRDLGGLATARNWKTVKKLLALADE